MIGLPEEIQQLISHQIDLETAKSLARTSRSLQDWGERRIWEQVEIGLKHWEDKNRPGYVPGITLPQDVLALCHLQQVHAALKMHPIRAEHVKRLIVTVPSPLDSHRSLLLSLLEIVSPHVQILDLYLPPTAIAVVKYQKEVVEDCVELLDQLNRRVKRWDKLLEIRVAIASGRGLSKIQTLLERSPRIQHLILRPLNIPIDPVFESSELDQGSTASNLDGLHSITITRLLPPTPPGSSFQLPSGLASFAYRDLRHTYDEISTKLISQARNLEKLVIGPQYQLEPIQLRRMVERLPRLKVLAIDMGSRGLATVDSSSSSDSSDRFQSSRERISGKAGATVDTTRGVVWDSCE